MPMIRNATLISLLFILTAAPALALEFPLGPRVGYTHWDGINQMHFGIHAKLGELLPNVALTPNIELGFGAGYTIITLNGDLAYQFTELTSAPWGSYAGGSLSFNYLDHDLLEGNVDLGFSAIIGGTRMMSNGHEMLGEIRLGILDSPDFKLTFGYTFF